MQQSWYITDIKIAKHFMTSTGKSREPLAETFYRLAVIAWISASVAGFG